MTKKNYFRPESSVIYLQAEQALLNFSATTSNPLDGGDPTGGAGNGGATSPFGAPAGAPDGGFDLQD